MKYSWSTNLYDSDGDMYERCVLVFSGENTILKFKDADELKEFAHSILRSIDEIKSQN